MSWGGARPLARAKNAIKGLGASATDSMVAQRGATGKTMGCDSGPATVDTTSHEAQGAKIIACGLSTE